MLPVKGATVQLGKPRKFPSYGWDNEYGTRDVVTPDFQSSKYMITNGEFLEFVKAGGYRTEEYWSEDGWGWKSYRNRKEPMFWEKDGPEASFRYTLRTVFEEVDMIWDAPVCVNHHEAKAYCAWKSEQDSESYRLPAESEFNLLKSDSMSLEAARTNPNNDPVLSKNGFEFANEELGNVNMAYGSETPVTLHQATEGGFHDVVGNVWQHCEDHFNPLEEGLVSFDNGVHTCNNKIHPVYDDFSVPCYDGRHDMILGGSFMSTGNEASTFSRFHFRRHFMQHAGFRLVTSDGEIPAYQFDKVQEAQEDQEAQGVQGTHEVPEESSSQSVGEALYETKALVDMYLGMHFSKHSGEAENIPYMMPHEHSPQQHTASFPQRVAELVVDLDTTSEKKRALDLGCAGTLEKI